MFYQMLQAEDLRVIIGRDQSRCRRTGGLGWKPAQAEAKELELIQITKIAPQHQHLTARRIRHALAVRPLLQPRAERSK